MDKHFKEMTIQEMCHVMDIPFPAHMENKKDIKINHIALISSHVKEGSALDAEAFERGTSVYLAESHARAIVRVG